MEAIYEEFMVSVFFAVEGCFDPRTLQDDTLESTPLGSLANYREKVLDSVMCYVACNQKWLAHHRGPLVEAYPNQIPPRKYLSHKVAQALRLPYTCAEAFIKFKQLLEKCKADWDSQSKEHDEQMKLCIEILQLGCYVLPGEVIASQKFEEFLKTCMKKELMTSLINIRRGNDYNRIKSDPH